MSIPYPIKGKFLKKANQIQPTGRDFAESIGGVTSLVMELKQLQGEVINTVNEKINEVDSTLQDKINTLVDTTQVLKDTQDQAISIIKEIKVGPAGQDADEAKITAYLESKIPEPINIPQLTKNILAQVPKIDEKSLTKRVLKAIPENKASLKIIQEKFELDPMSVIEKIMAMPEDKFKLKTTQIDGLEQTISAFRNQLGRGYLHGGGDTVVAGTNITITTNSSGNKVINSSASASPLTTKGDIFGYSTTNARIPVGTNGQVLTADSTQTLGVKWAAVSAGTVTSVSVVTANGVSGSVANPTTTPAITLTLGAITPTSVNGNTITTGTGTLTLSTFTLTVTGTASIIGTNTGDVTLAGQNYLSISSQVITANPVNLASSNVTGVLPVANGGTATSTAFTQGSVIFAGASGTYTQDNAKFFWDDTNFRLGIGTTAPGQALEVYNGQILGNRSTVNFTTEPNPVSAVTVAIAAGGSVNTGDHYYKVQYITALGATSWSPISLVATTSAGNNTVNVSAIPTGTTGVVTARKLYRTKAGADQTNNSNYFLVTTLNDNTTTTYIDTTADASISVRGNFGNQTAGLPASTPLLGTLNVISALQAGTNTILSVDGSSAITSPSGSTNLTFSGTIAFTNTVLLGNARGTIGAGTGNNLRIWNQASASIEIYPDQSNGLIIKNGGNVGLGNTNPGALLDIGLAGTTAGVVRLAGLTSGNVTVAVASIAGTWTFTLPTTGGSANQFLQTNGSGTASWAGIQGAITWTEVTGTSQTAAVNNGYILNNAGVVTLTLPTTAAVGDVVEVAGKGAGGWLIAQSSGQQIHFLSSDTTSGAGGSLASTNRRDSVRLLCTTANNEFTVLSSVGNFTIV